MASTPPEEKTVFERFLPIVDWLPKYKWGEWLRLDILAALAVWALLVPEAMAYAGIAGVSPEVGSCYGTAGPHRICDLRLVAALVRGAEFDGGHHLSVGGGAARQQ